MGTIQEFLDKYSDDRLLKLEEIRSLLSAFNPEVEELEEIIPAAMGSEMLRDEEIQHYWKYFKKAMLRWQQRQMYSDEPDDMDAYRLRLAREE